ncbi:hypothetical protein GALMADRAFT_147591 [Galerina marginata CBS 339.88]|uniref:Uncharacterized protein n=1 Tax=Galerina marginata (strain CBS 339.88) TaxID=685588 RepID=A0A067SAK5_GALM3|nr:hypothetical protein GALMADRAFT_147591 [Galerina marginata CBS 339.88]
MSLNAAKSILTPSDYVAPIFGPAVVIPPPEANDLKRAAERSTSPPPPPPQKKSKYSTPRITGPGIFIRPYRRPYTVRATEKTALPSVDHTNAYSGIITYRDHLSGIRGRRNISVTVADGGTYDHEGAVQPAAGKGTSTSCVYARPSDDLIFPRTDVPGIFYSVFDKIGDPRVWNPPDSIENPPENREITRE